MTDRKRASGLVRGLVMQALRDAVAARGPLCFTSRRSAAAELATTLRGPKGEPVASEATIRRALAHPDNADLASAIEAAIQPRSAFARDAHQGVPAEVEAAEIGSDPVVRQCGAPVVRQGDPGGCMTQPAEASPQVTTGAPPSEPVRQSRACEPRCSTSSALLSSAGPSVGPPLSTSLGRRPTRVRPSMFDGECRYCLCTLEVGQAHILVPYARKSGAVLVCIDCADIALELAQLEWDLAHPPTTPPHPEES